MDTYKERTIFNHVEEAKLEGVPLTQLYYAVGNLSVWASHAYKSVIIGHDGNNDLAAYYWKDEIKGRADYVRGAVWREDKNEYTFHS
jgi:hypothetical protein